MIAAHIKKIKHSKLCVTDVYLRHITVYNLAFQFCAWMWVAWAFVLLLWCNFMYLDADMRLWKGYIDWRSCKLCGLFADQHCGDRSGSGCAVHSPWEHLEGHAATPALWEGQARQPSLCNAPPSSREPGDEATVHHELPPGVCLRGLWLHAGRQASQDYAQPSICAWWFLHGWALLCAAMLSVPYPRPKNAHDLWKVRLFSFSERGGWEGCVKDNYITWVKVHPYLCRKS